MTEQRILGVDPGTAVTGYGIIEYRASGYVPVDYGAIAIPATMQLNDKYFAIFEALVHLLEMHRPEVVAIETQFVYKNPQSALKIGMARAVALIAARQQGAHVVEYGPTEVKKAVTGNGRANKESVQLMVQRRLKLSSLPTPFDAADALALALCHASRSVASLEKGLR